MLLTSGKQKCSIIQYLRLIELAVLTQHLSVHLVAQWYKVYAGNFWRTLYSASAIPLDYFLMILGCSVISLWHNRLRQLIFRWDSYSSVPVLAKRRYLRSNILLISLCMGRSKVPLVTVNALQHHMLSGGHVFPFDD